MLSFVAEDTKGVGRGGFTPQTIHIRIRTLAYVFPIFWPSTMLSPGSCIKLLSSRSHPILLFEHLLSSAGGWSCIEGLLRVLDWEARDVRTFVPTVVHPPLLRPCWRHGPPVHSERHARETHPTADAGLRQPGNYHEQLNEMLGLILLPTSIQSLTSQPHLPLHSFPRPAREADYLLIDIFS